MAMNKKEQAEMAALRRELLEARAFTRTEKVAPDVPPPTPGERGTRYTAGFEINVYNGAVNQAWSSSVSHGYGDMPVDGEYLSASQNSIWLYSTEVLALKAVRHNVENDCARKLADIDEKIAAAAPQKKEG